MRKLLILLFLFPLFTAAGFNIEIKQEKYKVIKEQDVVVVL